MKHPKKLKFWMKILLVSLGIAEKDDLGNWYYVKNQPDKLVVHCSYEVENREIDLREVEV